MRKGRWLVNLIRWDTNHCSSFKFHQSAPDLTKLDSLFGLLSAESSNFDDQLSEVEKEIRAHGMSAVFEKLSVTVATTEK